MSPALLPLLAALVAEPSPPPRDDVPAVDGGLAAPGAWLADWRGEAWVCWEAGAPACWQRLELAGVVAVDLQDPVIGRAASTKERYVRDISGTGPVAVVPLATAESLVGAIVIDRLLVQKDALSPVDFELFNLLGVHAATALSSALLREQAGTDAQALSIVRARALLA